MAETSEDMRNLYLNAYSLPKVSEAVRLRLTKEMQHILSSELPELEPKGYYEIEIKSYVATLNHHFFNFPMFS